jgi:uncharacterized protein YaiL (DUF2058 family)
MGNSLHDQLLNAGLVDEKQAGKTRQAKRKQRKQQGKQAKGAAAAAPDAREQERAAKAARDRELNRQRDAEAHRRALAAEVRQLVETHRQPTGEGEAKFHFADGTAIRSLHVSEALRGQLASGAMAVVRVDESYAVVPREAALRIAQRDPESVVVQAEPGASAQDEGDHPVPDDLMW